MTRTSLFVIATNLFVMVPVALLAPVVVAIPATGVWFFLGLYLILRDAERNHPCQ